MLAGNRCDAVWKRAMPFSSSSLLNDAYPDATLPADVASRRIVPMAATVLVKVLAVASLTVT